jgi:hypothetical protein
VDVNLVKEVARAILKNKTISVAEGDLAPVEIRAVVLVPWKKRNEWNYGCPFN